MHYTWLDNARLAIDTFDWKWYWQRLCSLCFTTVLQTWLLSVKFCDVPNNGGPSLAKFHEGPDPRTLAYGAFYRNFHRAVLHSLLFPPVLSSHFLPTSPFLPPYPLLSTPVPFPLQSALLKSSLKSVGLSSPRGSGAEPRPPKHFCDIRGQKTLQRSKISSVVWMCEISTVVWQKTMSSSSIIF